MGGKIYGHQNRKTGEKLYDFEEDEQKTTSAFNTDTDWDERYLK